MALGLLLIFIGVSVGVISHRMFHQVHIITYEQLLVYSIVSIDGFILGLVLAGVGIPMFIIGAKRIPSKLMDILKSSMHIRARAKISFLAQQLGTNEKDVIGTVSRLRSNGEPILIDDSTSEVIYNPTLLSPSKEIKKPSMTLYEKLTVILTILGILVSIIVTLMK